MAVTEFSAALNQVATERGIPVESVLESIRVALASAYKRDRKDVGEDVEIEDITVDLNTDTGEVRIIKDKKDVTPAGFGRIAAQTAKQVILQKIRETEKDVIIEEYKSKLGTIMSGTVFRIENGVIILDLGKAHGILPQSEQVEAEQYRLNQRLKVFIKDIKETSRGTEIIVSRADPDFIKKLFEQEVPEIASGVVRIEAMAREAGSRTKMAVSSSDEKVDPVGSCVGQKGVRVQSIISEVFGEKIDIIPYSSSPEKFVAASLSPARVTEVELDHDERKATVSVPEDQQSLAIGKEGQNARLANKLTKWKIDIKGAPGLFGTVAEAAEVAKGKKIIRGIWDEDIKKAEDLLDEEAEKLAENVAEEIEVAGENTDVPEEKSEQKEPDAKE
ncbi:MAG: NusA antitermination factor [candidate division WWE3 bacterium GW2011_GWA1_41_8]|uniref:Transcription termination/antitermination protein NusA n=2 Tax=Katanobacteria TaxID=422282 RepID=A0A0G0XCA0_UNCKA|nr:MAG: NusA antitermination factor [candidate division WWE3 bacterium GW2011_GWA1_41_8]OGC58328.1 MAG: transcription termination factor NusA [candidate division WWE3 bacterium RIFCSPLOWO2_01_FULL_41_9]